MIPRIRILFLGWAFLLALLAAEVGISLLPLGGSTRSFVLIPAVMMAGVIAVVFMELGRASSTARLFALAGVIWLVILLALGSLDPMTRIVYPTQSLSNGAY